MAIFRLYWLAQFTVLQFKVGAVSFVKAGCSGESRVGALSGTTVAVGVLLGVAVCIGGGVLVDVGVLVAVEV